MIRWILGAAFLRYGVVGFLIAVGGLVMAGWLALSIVWSWIEGALWLTGFASAIGWLLLLIFFVRWLRGRRPQDHLMGYGRRRDW